MSKVVLFTSLTLDGVMQAPGRPDEDRRGGFEHGGWATPYADSVMGSVAGESMATSGALLLGRRTYEDFFSVWPNRPKPNPFTDVLNNAQKYVASRTLKEPLPWSNSTLLEGDAATAVARLRDQPGKDLVILGSGGAGPVADAAEPRRQVPASAGPGDGTAPLPGRQPEDRAPTCRHPDDHRGRRDCDLPPCRTAGSSLNAFDAEERSAHSSVHQRARFVSSPSRSAAAT